MKAKILVIDDNYSVRSVFGDYLSENGYEVVEAENGKIGLEEIQKNVPDIVTLDLIMPEMDGYAFLAEVKKKYPDLPVIIISGVQGIENAVKALHLGAWDYIEKPIVPFSLLVHTIEKNLEKADLIKQNKEYQRKLEKSLNKINDDENAARKIQLKLFPPENEKINNYSFQRYIIPSAILSGDFIDYFQVDDSNIAFYIADVSGHGVSSALLTVYLKSFMKTYFGLHNNQRTKTIINPNILFKNLNTEFIKENFEKHIVMFFGIINCDTNVLTYVNCAQFPFPIIFHDDKFQFIERTGNAIGLFSFAQYQQKEIKLPEKFMLAIFSDGVLDALPLENTDAKIEYLTKLNNYEKISDYVSTLKNNKELPDDITVLIINKE